MGIEMVEVKANGHQNGGRHADEDVPHITAHPPIAGPDSKADIEHAVREILINLGEDPDRDGLQRTPHRVAKSYFELLEGYGQDVETIINGAMFDVEYGEGEMVVVADIEYNSMCEHHMLPFVGKAHVAYIPRDKVVGLSKIPRIVDMFARRLQVQERLTNEVADALQEALDPVGVIVVFEGAHSCAAPAIRHRQRRLHRPRQSLPHSAVRRGPGQQ